jgi:hypothetical protein
MVAHHITIQCSLFIHVLLEKELDVNHFIMDLPLEYEGHCISWQIQIMFEQLNL